MKGKRIFFFVLSIFFAHVPLISAMGQDIEWKGQIEYKDGIKVIKNPNEPLFGSMTFDLKEDLSIGRGDNEAYIFYRVNDVDVDREGNILVLDSGNSRIQKFDKNGVYLLTIGRKGEGPGEFARRPGSLTLDSEENLYVQEQTRIHIFNKKGEFLESFKFSDAPREYGITGEQNFMFMTSSILRPYQDQIEEIALYDPEGRKLKTIVSYTEPVGWISTDRVRFSIPSPFAPHLYFCALSEDRSVYGYSLEYRLFVMNSAGETVLIIEKEEKPEPVTREEKNRYINTFFESYKKRGYNVSKSDLKKALHSSPHKPFYGLIKKDDVGNIYVHNPWRSLPDKRTEEKRIVDYDVFSGDGYYLYIVSLPFSPLRIKNGFAYRVETHPESGEVKVKRYKIINWDQMKAMGGR